MDARPDLSCDKPMLFPFMDDQPTTRWPFVTVLIIALNVLVYLGVNNLTPEEQNIIQIHYGFVPARMAQLVGGQEEVRVVYEEYEQPAQFREPVKVEKVERLPPNPGQVLITLITAMFLHGDFFHIAGNMWFFWLYGNNVEDRLGHVLFFFYYFAGGIFATLSHAFFAQITGGGDMPMIGASGAVAAVLGGYAITFPWARVRTLVFFFFITVIDLPALAVLGFWFAGELISGFVQATSVDAAGVAYWAHVGGFCFGLVVMPLLCRIVPPITPEPLRSAFDEDDAPSPPYPPAYQPYPPPPPRRYGSFWPPRRPPPDPTGIHFEDGPGR